MRTLSRILVAVAVGALAAPAVAGAASKAAGPRGIVVQRDARAGVVVVAGHTGSLKRLHVAKPNRFAMGTVVQMRGKRLVVVGHAHKAKLRGIVVHSSHAAFALAGNGSVLAVSSPTPPPAGEQVTATVQVTPTELDDDNGDEQVNGTNAVSAEVRGTVLLVDPVKKTLTLTVDGFPSGLVIGLGTVTLPTTLAVGTRGEARVALGPDPLNPSAIVLTLVSLHVEGNNQGGEHGSFVKAEGQVMSVTEADLTPGATGLITISGEHGTVTFVIPSGFGPTGVVVGDEVDASGTASTTTPAGNPTLVRLESDGNNNDNNGSNNNNNNGGDEGDSGSGGQGSGGGDD